MKKIIFSVTLSIFISSNSYSSVTVFNPIQDIKDQIANSELIQQTKMIAEELETVKDQYNETVKIYNASMDKVEEWQAFAKKVERITQSREAMMEVAKDTYKDMVKAGYYKDDTEDRYQIVWRDIESKLPSIDDGIDAFQNSKREQIIRQQREVKMAMTDAKQVIMEVEEDNAQMAELLEKHKNAESQAEKATLENEISLKQLEILQGMHQLQAYSVQMQAEDRMQAQSTSVPTTTRNEHNQQLQNGSYNRWELSSEEKAFEKRMFGAF